MDLNEILWLDRLQRSGTTNGPKPAPADREAFQKLLKEFQGAATTAGAATKDLSKFTDAMRQADHDFDTLMQLRRKLEDAFRKHQP